jgi:hypothetical protein
MFKHILIPLVFATTAFGQLSGATTVPASSSGGAVAYTITSQISSSSSSRGSSSGGSAYYVSPSGSDSNSGTLGAPFKTLAKAQSAMQASSIKTTDLRAGTYPKTALILTAADNGETWSYYAPDGYDSATLDGGSTSPTTGGNPITIDGGSNITINGLTIQNFPVWAVGLHGGPAWPEFGFTNSVPVASGNKIINNVIRNGYQTTGSGWRGAIYSLGSVPNTAIAHNGIDNMYAGGIWFNTNVGPQNYSPAGNYNGLDIEYNAITHTCQKTGDCGAIYLQDTNFVSTGVTITQNFIGDYQGANVSGINNPRLPRAVAIYFDQGASNAAVTSNVIGNTSNVITNPLALGDTQALQMSESRNITFSCNLVDLGTTGQIGNLSYQRAGVVTGADGSAMTGNSLTKNVYFGSWSGAQASYSLGTGPYAYISDHLNPAHANVSGNLYFNYGSGSLSTKGNFFSDTAPVTGKDPLVSGFYQIAAASPFYSTLRCPVITGGWGPPGYVIPAGTAPSH